MSNFKISSCLSFASKLANGDCNWETKSTESFSSQITRLFSNPLSSTFCISISIPKNSFNPSGNSKIKEKYKYSNGYRKRKYTSMTGNNKRFIFRNTYKMCLKSKGLANITIILQDCFTNSRTYQQSLTVFLKNIYTINTCIRLTEYLVRIVKRLFFLCWILLRHAS